MLLRSNMAYLSGLIIDSFLVAVILRFKEYKE